MVQQTPNIHWDLLFETLRPHADYPGVETHSESDVLDQDEENWYVCRKCRHKLTRPSHRINVRGGHTHTFANPSGIVFEIACFNSAQGYSFMGPVSTEFAWFAGFSWRIMICSSCLTHLGWYFSSHSGGGFFAFILDKIRMLSSAKD